MSENREATIGLLLASQCALTARVNANAEAIALTSDVEALAATVRTLMTNVTTLTVDVGTLAGLAAFGAGDDSYSGASAAAREVTSEQISRLAVVLERYVSFVHGSQRC
jgi:hypothetical protein